jgi:hypothetical protein
MAEYRVLLNSRQRDRIGVDKYAAIILNTARTHRDPMNVLPSKTFLSEHMILYVLVAGSRQIVAPVGRWTKRSVLLMCFDTPIIAGTIPAVLKASK